MKYRYPLVVIALASQSSHVPVSNALEIGQIFGFQENNYRMPNENDLFSDLGTTTTGLQPGSTISNTDIAQGSYSSGSSSGSGSKGKGASGKRPKGDEGNDDKCCSCTCFDPDEYNGGSQTKGDDGHRGGYYSGYNDNGDYCECSCSCGSKATMPLIPTVAPTIAPTPPPTDDAPTASPTASPTQKCDIDVNINCLSTSGVPCNQLPVAAPIEGPNDVNCIEEICFIYQVANIGIIDAEVMLLQSMYNSETTNLTDQIGSDPIPPGETRKINMDCNELIQIDVCVPGEFVNVLTAEADPNCQGEDEYEFTITPLTVAPTPLPTTALPTASPTMLPTESCDIIVSISCETQNGVQCNNLALPEGAVGRDCIETICFTYTVSNVGPVEAELAQLERAFNGGTSNVLMGVPLPVGVFVQTRKEADCVNIETCGSVERYINVVTAKANPNCGAEATYLIEIEEEVVDAESSPTSSLSPLSAPTTSTCDRIVLLISCETESGIACDEIDLGSSVSGRQDCNEVFRYTYIVTNTEDTAVSIDSLRRNFNGKVEDLTAQLELVSLAPGQSATIEEKVNVDICGDETSAPRVDASRLYETTIEADGSFEGDNGKDCQIAVTIVVEL